MSHDIFLSYRRTDREFAAQLVRELEKRGLTVWYDADIDGAQDWRPEIGAAVEAGKMLVILFSESSNEGRSLKKELALADSLQKPVVPILIDDCKPKGPYLLELADRNWIEAWPEPHSHIAELVTLLSALAGKWQAPAPAEPPLVANDEMPRETGAAGAPGMASAYVGKKRSAAAGGPPVWIIAGVAVFVIGAIAAFLMSGSVVTYALAALAGAVAAFIVRALLSGQSALTRFNANLRRL
jgi:hypothetical protein